MFRNIKTAVIGLGNMGQNHVRILSEISRLVGVADIDKRIGLKTAHRYHIPFYKDYVEMIEKVQPDAVSIVVPTVLHRDIAVTILSKHIPCLVEKPIAGTVQEARDIIRISKKTKTMLMVGHVERYNPAVKKMKEIIKNGDLGTIISIIVRRVGGFAYRIRDVGIAVDLAIHDVDVVNFLLDKIPSKAIINRQKSFMKDRDDSVELYLQYGKTSAFIQANWITPVKIRKLNITGTKGYTEMDYISQQIVLYKNVIPKYKHIRHGFSDYILQFGHPEVVEINIEKREPLKEELLAYLQNVSEKTYPDPTYALSALQIVLK